MKMSGLIRRTGVKSCRFIVSRASDPLIASPDGTGHRGPEGHHSGPGYLFPGGSTKSFYVFLRSFLEQPCRLPSNWRNYE